MANEVYRTCPNCGKVNLNRDYCQKCGELINILLKRKQEREKRALEKRDTASPKKPNRITTFFENAKENDNIVIKYTARFFYSIWVIVIAIGGFLALLFGYIAA